MAISVAVPKNLSGIKTKVAMNLTKRQLICFGAAGAVGIPFYIFTKDIIGTQASALIMVAVMLPFFFLAMYEKDGFPAEKILMTGNPVRQNLLDHALSREDAIRAFGLDPNKKTILILGGSLGARTINNTLIAGLPTLKKNNDIQFIWQTGKIYHQQVMEAVGSAGSIPNLYVADFIKDMATAYSAADLVISRAGAGSISEFCLLSKPVILVPSPNVAEDHQTKNALALVNKGAAIYVKDTEAETKLLPAALETIADTAKLKDLSDRIAKLALPDSATIIAKEVIKLAVREQK